MKDLFSYAECKIPIYFVRGNISKDADPVLKVDSGHIIRKIMGGSGFLVVTSDGISIAISAENLFLRKKTAKKYLRERRDYLYNHALIECEYRTQMNQWDNIEDLQGRKEK